MSSVLLVTAFNGDKESFLLGDASLSPAAFRSASNNAPWILLSLPQCARGCIGAVDCYASHA